MLGRPMTSGDSAQEARDLEGKGKTEKTAQQPNADVAVMESTFWVETVQYVELPL